MQTKRFTYTGRDSAVTLRVPDAQGVMIDHEVVLWSGRVIELPADHAYVETLLRAGLLVPNFDAVTLTLKSKKTASAANEI